MTVTDKQRARLMTIARIPKFWPPTKEWQAAVERLLAIGLIALNEEGYYVVTAAGRRLLTTSPPLAD